MVKFVRRATIGAGLTIGLLILAVVAARRFNVGGQLTDAAGGLGSFFPNVLKAFGSGAAEGAGQLGEEFKKIGENFQRGIGGGLLFSEQTAFGGGGFVGGTVNEENVLAQGNKIPSFLRSATEAFQPQQTRNLEPKRLSNLVNLNETFSRTGQLTRFASQARNEETLDRLKQTFGGQIQASAALQRAVAESRARFPEFFKVR